MNKSDAAWGDKSFNDACFVIEKGAEKDKDGKTLIRFRHLPHHTKNATDPNSNETVDLPHLRNALARVNQVKPVKEGTQAFRKRALAHLQKHAKVLLKGESGMSGITVSLDPKSRQFVVVIDGEIVPVDSIYLQKHTYDDEVRVDFSYTVTVTNNSGLKEERRFFLPAPDDTSAEINEHGLASEINDKFDVERAKADVIKNLASE